MTRLALFFVLLASCSAPTPAPTTTGPVPTSATTAPATTSSTTVPDTTSTTTGPEATTIDTGDLGPVPVTTIAVDGRELDVAVVSTADDRSRGLRGVTDLGELDGMLFTWGGETVTSRFTMADTLIALDVAFFDEDGEFVDGLAMVPCDETPCPPYAAAGPYAYALESPAGSLAGIGPGSILVLPE